MLHWFTSSLYGDANTPLLRSPAITCLGGATVAVLPVALASWPLAAVA
jgi:hypothetical protein